MNAKKLALGLSLLTSIICGYANAGMFSKDEWEKDDCTDRHSKAWCIVKLGSLSGEKQYRFDDVKLTDEQKLALTKQADSTSGYILQGAAVSVGASTAMGLSAGAGLSSLIGSAVFQAGLVSSILDGMVFNGKEVFQNRLFVWLPAEKTSREAYTEFFSVYLDGWKAALGADKIEAEIITDPDYNRPTVRIVARGGVCGANQLCLMKPNAAFAHLKLVSGERDLKKSDSVPAFLGKGPVFRDPVLIDATPLPDTYFVASADCDNAIPWRCKEAQEKKLTQEQVVVLSSKLPSYAYIYVGAIKDDKRSFPFMVNQGKILLFAK